MSRAKRRHHRRRLQKKRKRYWGDFGEYKREGSHQGVTLGLKMSAPKPQSSCVCCMNQRQVEGPTRQEIKHAQSHSFRKGYNKEWRSVKTRGHSKRSRLSSCNEID